MSVLGLNKQEDTVATTHVAESHAFFNVNTHTNGLRQIERGGGGVRETNREGDERRRVSLWSRYQSAHSLRHVRLLGLSASRFYFRSPDFQCFFVFFPGTRLLKCRRRHQRHLNTYCRLTGLTSICSEGSRLPHANVEHSVSDE